VQKCKKHFIIVERKRREKQDHSIHKSRHKKEKEITITIEELHANVNEQKINKALKVFTV
jgi:hypothetical protein